MLSKITNTINEWDPINFFPHAPSDEYAAEIERINNFMEDNRDCTVDLLSIKIHEIFVSAFDTDLFAKSIDNCKIVAQKILFKE